jgi:hypothetical protein
LCTPIFEGETEMSMKYGSSNVLPGSSPKEKPLPDHSPGITGAPKVGNGGVTTPLRHHVPNAPPVKPQRPPPGR